MINKLKTFKRYNKCFEHNLEYEKEEGGSVEGVG
jgi:hypothetical protein